MTETPLRCYLEFAMDAAWKAGRRTLAWFQAGVVADRKADASPVTVADREAEQVLREAIASMYPEHAIVGEEFGDAGRTSTHRWILDPIDGTQSFVRGVPLYGTLVALEIGGEPVVGVAHFPALGEMYSAARGEGAWWNGRRIRVSATDAPHETLVLCTDLHAAARRFGGSLDALVGLGRLQRGWGDCYGHCLVASGRAEIMLDPAMNPWDCAALVPILLEAGGTFTDWTGAMRIDGGDAVSTNGVAFERTMQALRGAARQ